MLSFRQRLTRLLYPLIMKLSKTGRNGQVLTSPQLTSPPDSFYQLAGQLSGGQALDFSAFRGKQVLLVNTASGCGYTSQYAELQQLAERYPDKLVVLGFPANDFAEQEKADDHTIQQFCQLNFGVTFPLFRKSVVRKQPGQHPVYQWLTDPSHNGWNQQPPVWNFAKYLVDAQGRLRAYFGPAVSPLSEAVTHYL